MDGFGFNVNITPIQLETFVIVQPAYRCLAVGDFQWRTEYRFVRHLCLLHRRSKQTIFYAAGKRPGEVFRTR